MKKRWKEIWGDSEKKALDFLFSKGYVLNEGGSFTHKNEEHIPRPKDLDAIDYLVEEWGYKGLD